MWDLLFPAGCLACGEGKRFHLGLCDRCLDQVSWQRLAGCINCGRIGCARGCVPSYHRYRRVLALAAYNGPWRSLVLALKNGRDWPVAREVAGEMVSLAEAAEMIEPDLVLAPPGATTGAWKRQLAKSLAGQVANLLGVPLFEGLARLPGRPAQVDLDSSRRLEGLAEYLRLQDEHLVYGKNIWLVDDVFTTGGTAAACTEKLLAAGASGVWVLALAA